ncbi:MAG: ABC transporter ATP-binding protein [Rhodospirillales bacterium]|nr:ABC transporter ATP-binding protein [Rhodospirillales bacterium]
MSADLLIVEDIQTFYGHSQALFGVSLTVRSGEVTTLLGRNGMGKTTTVRSIMGLTKAAQGTIRFEGKDIRSLPAYRVAQLGMGLVPEGRQIFPNLTLEENLLAAAANRRGRAQPWTLERVYELFPRLAERRRNMGANLSGGEQQMLAVGRALMTNPELLILDEATEGLAPLIREEIWSCLTHIKGMGQSILLIDKNLDALLAIGDRHTILEKGRVVWQGSSAQLAADAQTQEQYLSI